MWSASTKTCFAFAIMMRITATSLTSNSSIVPSGSTAPTLITMQSARNPRRNSSAIGPTMPLFCGRSVPPGTITSKSRRA